MSSRSQIVRQVSNRPVLLRFADGQHLCVVPVVEAEQDNLSMGERPRGGKRPLRGERSPGRARKIGGGDSPLGSSKPMHAEPEAQRFQLRRGAGVAFKDVAPFTRKPARADGRYRIELSRPRCLERAKKLKFRVYL